MGHPDVCLHIKCSYDCCGVLPVRLHCYSDYFDYTKIFFFNNTVFPYIPYIENKTCR